VKAVSLRDSRPVGAGLLVTADDRYLVQQRGPRVRRHPGCWEITAGGLLRDGEDALDGALRKHCEEMGEPPELLVIASVTWLRVPGSPHDSRQYTAFLARAAARYEPAPAADRVAAWAWLPRSDVEQLQPLHPNFAVEFAALLARA
jgi:8-oxo-dGTP pyrophosphatase MutT (NUDIX family)